MPVITYGINHHCAPIEIREKMTFDSTRTPQALKELISNQAVNEAVLLSTCNRTEIYTSSLCQLDLQKWFNDDVTSYYYRYHGLDAVRHLMRVASGLDSMVLGEPQILGQIKHAYSLACEAGTVGHHLRRLFPAVFATSKAIRNKTTIGKNAVSIAYATTQLAKRIFTKLESRSALLVGAGETIELIANHLNGCGIKNIIIANRTVEKARKLADPLRGKAIRIGDIPQYLKNSDIVISATASQLPILGKGMIESTLKQTKRHPIFMVDLAVPRDIEPEVGQLQDVYLYNLDDLQNIITQNLQDRHQAALQAEAMVEIQAQNYIRQLRVLDASDMIRRYREQIEFLRDKELIKAFDQLQRGENPQAVMSMLANTLTSKFMHSPTVKIREAAFNEDLDLLMFAKDLLDI